MHWCPDHSTKSPIGLVRLVRAGTNDWRAFAKSFSIRIRRRLKPLRSTSHLTTTCCSRTRRMWCTARPREKPSETGTSPRTDHYRLRSWYDFEDASFHAGGTLVLKLIEHLGAAVARAPRPSHGVGNRCPTREPCRPPRRVCHTFVHRPNAACLADRHGRPTLGLALDAHIGLVTALSSKPSPPPLRTWQRRSP